MPTTGQTTAPETWREKVAHLWWLTKVADNALQVDKDNRRQTSIERLIKKTQDGTLGMQTDEPMGDGDEMGVNVGNEIHYHMTNPPVQDPAPRPTTDPTSGTSTLAKAAIAGVAAAGLGSGVGVPLAYMLSQSDQQPTPVVQPASDMDTDTQYGLRIYRGDESKE